MELSHPLLRAPFEKVNKSFRLYHKQLTKELGAVTKRLAQLRDEQPPAQRMDVDALVARLDALTASIEQLKHDTKRSAAEQQRDLELCLLRAQYVKELAAATPRLDPTTSRSADTVSDANNDEQAHKAQQTLHNRLVADYLLSNGHVASAALVQTRTGVTDLVDFELHVECAAIVRDLRAHSTAQALAWCGLNASRLRRLQSRLEFRLRLQEVVELVRAQQPLAAIEYAQMYVTPLALQRDDDAAQRADLADVELAMGTLAFADPAATSHARYAALFAPAQWTQLVDAFTHTFRQVYGLHDPPSLCLALYSGLSTLNTRTCARTRDVLASAKRLRDVETETETKSETETQTQIQTQQHGDSSDGPQSKKTKRSSALTDDDIDVHTKTQSSSSSVQDAAAADAPICPTCSEVGGALCAGLPFAYHPQSRLVCRVTHRVMDEHNPPRVLPNGRVYSQDGIAQLLQLTERSGMVQCLETHELFAASDVKPVYIL